MNPVKGAFMYKVGIIDDEPIIVEGLRRGIHWEAWGCEVVGIAYNGQEGLKLVREKQPDLLFSDISMSGMDGLTMIASIKSEFPKIQVSILTGYRNFDYAQRAIQLGVTRYLLKPSRMDEIEDSVRTMIEQVKVRKRLMDADSMEPMIPEEEEEKAYSYEAAEANNFIVRNALEYIDHHYSEKLKLSDVADRIYVSQWHLSKLLNKHTGQNFSELLNKVRVDQAKHLLENPALRIGDIAESVGFVDVAHFSRVFKKTEGISANEYRNKRF